MPTAVARLDGRTARSARSRAAVVDAMLDLLLGGDLQPTAARVAERAGVSLRLVFQHFDDLEALYAEAADRQMERLATMMHDPPVDGPLAARLAAFVERRSELLESVAPIRRAAQLRAPFSPVLHTRLQAGRGLTRAETEEVFARELATRPAAAQRELAAALSVAAGFSAWESLRAHHGLNVAQARKVMTRILRALLKERR